MSGDEARPRGAGRSPAPATIRELGSGDAHRFRSIRLEALRSAPDAFGQTLDSALALDDPTWRERLDAVRAQGGAILVAECGGATAGMCGVGTDETREGAAFFWGMFVTAPRRGEGVGAAFLRVAEAWAMEHGRAEMHARVAAPNDAAIRFYRRHGYEVGPAAGTLRPGSDIPVHPIRKRLQAG